VRRKIILLPEALLDAQSAYRWYEEQDAGLGEEFLRYVEAAYSKISESPEQYPIRFDSFRRILIRRFPYAVYFEHDETNIWVLYIFHCSQHPDKLRDRLKGL
jgi:plasmid stabilization system protein ParE